MTEMHTLFFKKYIKPINICLNTRQSAISPPFTQIKREKSSGMMGMFNLKITFLVTSCGTVDWDKYTIKIQHNVCIDTAWKVTL